MLLSLQIWFYNRTNDLFFKSKTSYNVNSILSYTCFITCILTVALKDVLCITYAVTKQFILQCTNQFWWERTAFVTRKCNWERSNNFSKRITDLFLFIVLLRWVNCHRILNLLQIVFIISLTTSTSITNSDQRHTCVSWSW